jgi:hypothetical protein
MGKIRNAYRILVRKCAGESLVEGRITLNGSCEDVD